MHEFKMVLKGATCVEDAQSCLVHILFEDYGSKARDEAVSKGFKRILPTNPNIDEFINKRFQCMHLYSPTEYMWMGFNDSGESKYIFWGTTKERETKLNRI
jgi:hypothetical protein